MKHKTDAYPNIGKTIFLDLEKWGHSPFLLETFKVYAINNDWTHEEVFKICDFLKGKIFEEQLAILTHYCKPPLPDSDEMIQQDVQFLLDFLNLNTHYLSSKPIETWDEYDYSNYKSLRLKATSHLRRVYALYSSSVKEEDKYRLDSPPGKYFESRKKAEALLNEASRKNTKVYAVWVKEENAKTVNN